MHTVPVKQRLFFLLLLLCSSEKTELPIFQKIIWYWLLMTYLCTNVCSKFWGVSHHLGSNEWQLSGERAGWVVRKVAGAPFLLFVLESAKACWIERYVLGAGWNCQIQSHFLLKSLCPHLRLCELKEVRRKMCLSFIYFFTPVHLTALRTPPVFSNRVKFLWLLVQVLSHSSVKGKPFSDRRNVIVKTQALTEAINILRSLRSTRSKECWLPCGNPCLFGHTQAITSISASIHHAYSVSLVNVLWETVLLWIVKILCCTLCFYLSLCISLNQQFYREHSNKSTLLK